MCIIVNLLKKGDPTLSGNYRGIALSSVMGNFFCLVVQNKLTYFLEKYKLLSNAQNGFKPNRSCSQHIFSVYETCGEIRRKNKGTLERKE